MSRGRGAGARNVLGVALIGIAMLVLGGLGAASFLMRAPPTDPETLCRTDALLAAHTIILVDATDRLETAIPASSLRCWRRSARVFRSSTGSPSCG
jgi:hypothetical protein